VKNRLPILRTQDGGVRWRQIAAGLIYAGSSLFEELVSTNHGDTWQANNGGLERKDIPVLASSDDGSVLYAGAASGTCGSGVWRLGTPPGQPPSLAATPASSPTAPPSTSAAERIPTSTSLHPDEQPREGVPFLSCPTAGLMILCLGVAWACRRM